MQSILVEKEIYTVSRLNNAVRVILENNFPFVWVEGEISNFAAPHSGHWYFSLKDATAQIRCAMFKGNQRKINFLPKDGVHVLIKARVSLYENRGDFQLIAEDMEERGEGKLRRAFEVLKKKLEALGLFDPNHKKPLPLFPKQIGVITSATGAAIRDILHVLKRRFPCVPVIIYPTLVQGEAAAPCIVKAIETANNRQECDVLILARGGGSLEDLWPFNEEIVAHAIYQSQIPMISGVGHEVDFTIADFVADQRAPTPSAAAEMVTPEKSEFLKILLRQKQQFDHKIQLYFTFIIQRLEWMQKHLNQMHPERILKENMQRLDYLERSLIQLENQTINKFKNTISSLTLQFHQHSPAQKIMQLQNQIKFCMQQLNANENLLINQLHKRLAEVAGKLDALSPLNTLKRGYAIATKDQHVLRDTTDIEVGDKIKIKLMINGIHCSVESVE